VTAEAAEPLSSPASGMLTSFVRDFAADRNRDVVQRDLDSGATHGRDCDSQEVRAAGDFHVDDREDTASHILGTRTVPHSPPVWPDRVIRFRTTAGQTRRRFQRSVPPKPRMSQPRQILADTPAGDPRPSPQLLFSKGVPLSSLARFSEIALHRPKPESCFYKSPCQTQSAEHTCWGRARTPDVDPVSPDRLE
jgi:hypothetical protein